MPAIETSKQNGKKGGRPKGSVSRHTIDTVEMRKAVIARVQEQLEPLMQAKLDLALGVYEEKVESDGTTRIYKNKPDGNAIQYLLSQGIGKPKETVEVQNETILKVDF